MEFENVLRLPRLRGERCGIVLAAGDGTRLAPFVRRHFGQEIPKQFVRFTGTRSMLEHTLHRAAKLIPKERLFTVIGQAHLSFPGVPRQIAALSAGTVIVQPGNRDTGPGLLLPLLHLRRRYPGAIVTIFPSDHFILEEDLFMAHVERACAAVEEDGSRVILLGMRPCEPEPDYGYIVPGEAVGPPGPRALRHVARFVEKPDSQTAEHLALAGGLWNTLVMTFRADTLLDLARSIAPALSRGFERIDGAIGTPVEQGVIDEVYRAIEPVNLSRCFLESLALRRPASLLVLPVEGVYWSDWGTEERILHTLEELGQTGAVAPIPAAPLAVSLGGVVRPQVRI